MKRSMRIVAVITGLLVAGALQAADFAFDFAGAPASIQGANDKEVTFVVNATLTSTNNDKTYGAQGWSLGIAAENCEISTVTAKGMIVQTIPYDDPDDEPDMGVIDPFFKDLFTADFRVNEKADSNWTAVPPADPNPNPADIFGAVSAIVLNQKKFQPLMPTGTQPILKLTVKARIPATGEACGQARLYFLSGLKGSGQPVNNVVTFDGASIPPTLGEVIVDLCPPRPLFNLAVVASPAGVPAPDGDTIVARDVTIPTGQTEIEVPVDTMVLLSSEGFPAAGGGGQGWSLSIAHDACLSVSKVTVKGAIVQTIPYDDPDDEPDMGVIDPFFKDLFTADFRVAEEADSNWTAVPPADPNPNPAGIDGVVSAIVLNQKKFQPLLANSTNPILKMTYNVLVKVGETTNCRIYFLNGLKGAGQPVNNVITYDGASKKAFKQQGLVLQLRGVEAPVKSDFVRGDANGDDIQDIADAVNIVYNVVPGLQGDPTQYVKILCTDSGDANSDGQMNLADAIFLIDWQFRGGEAPAAPFGVCGTVASSTDATCPPGSTQCP